MALSLTPNVHLEKDASGIVRHLRHMQEPFTSATGLAPNALSLAHEYVGEIAPLISVPAAMLGQLAAAPAGKLTADPVELRLAHHKALMETTTVSYAQTVLGLPIWEAGVSVTVHDRPLRVTSAVNTLHYDVKVKRPGPKARFLAENLERPALVARVLRLEGAAARRLKINRTRLVVYRYEADQRLHPESRIRQKAAPLQEGPPTLPLPPVPKGIAEGGHHVVTEVLFSLPVAGWGNLNWRAFVECESGTVLYLRAFTACASGMVYAVDPLTATGNAAITPTSPAATLDAQRTNVALQGIDPANPQDLSGEFVELVERDAPVQAAPTQPSPPADFTYSVPTPDFAAVNAYHHCDALFRLVQGMGFTIANYFDETTFPVPVDHWGKNLAVNAHCAGNMAGTGIGEFVFGVEATGTQVGIAADWRVVLHEFGHGLLWDSVHWPNFGFAHSAGDSLAAILNDPGSLAPDRFLSFPWVTDTRRHDRDVTAGWAWGGTNDVGGYSSEQILSTTLFRAYRSSGGDAVHSNAALQLQRRQFAARYLSYLIIRAIGSLATSPVTPTATPDVFATALMNADVGTTNFEGHPGGAFHKVVRWAFEKQGLYQPPGAPTPVVAAGAPPEVDVYIDDGRAGEYPYQQNFWNTQDIWNRLAADGGTAHQTPVTNQTNYLYVRVKNRGSQNASGVAVRAFHCEPGTGLVWPDDWMAVTPASLNVAGGVPAGGSVVVGPFEWTPTVVGHECLLAYVSATGDLANADTASMLPCATGPIPHWRLVPFDNNIGQRNVAPVAGGGGSLRLKEAFEMRRFRVNNPYERAVRIRLESELPRFLRDRGWKLAFLNPGGDQFTLGPRGHRYVQLALQAGADFDSAAVKAAGADRMIEVRTLLDGQVIGGMSYLVDPDLAVQPNERPAKPGGAECTGAARELLACLDLPGHEVSCVRIRRVSVDIDVADKCC